MAERILTIGKYGWADVKIGEFHGKASYLQETPFDFLRAFANYTETNIIPTIDCDEEGSRFIVVVDEMEVYIIAEREDAQLYHFPVCRKKFMHDVVKDIEDQIDAAAEFVVTLAEPDSPEYKALMEQRKALLYGFITQLKERYNWE